MKIETLNAADRVRLYTAVDHELLYDSAGSAMPAAEAIRLHASESTDTLCIADHRGHRWSGLIRLAGSTLTGRAATEYIEHMLVLTNPFLAGAPTEPGPAPYMITREAAQRLKLGADFLKELNEQDQSENPACDSIGLVEQLHEDLADRSRRPLFP